ncbi:MAG: hypothetical protein Q9O24_07260 [Gammaproteobacteria bacterium]|nr:hypothetical protein [Gammaproteobacteria bacterium]
MKRLLKYFSIVAVVFLPLSACTETPVLLLGQEKMEAGEEQTIKDISQLLAGHLKEQYEHEMFLRDTHPKSNGCLHADFVVNANLNKKYQQGIFRPNASYPVWMRFSNSVEELTDDHEDDFRGLGMKLSGVTGERVAFPGDEQSTQDFLFLGHDAFFAANPEQFFDFFDATFSGRSFWFLLTHPKGFFNIMQGSKAYANPLNVNWNSVTAYGLGERVNGAFKTTVRYALQTCAENEGDVPKPLTADYLEENMQAQLSKGTACLNFFIQEQIDPVKMPVENALVAWDQSISPLIKLAQIRIPKQNFTSDEQKVFCENISFNPGHSLTAHEPIGGINRARKVVMKDISDLRLMQNGVARFEPTGRERFEP